MPSYINVPEDLETHREQRNEERKRYYGKTANKYEARAWTESEDQLVLKHLIPDIELSEKIGRSVSAIQNRRVKLKKSIKDNTPNKFKSRPWSEEEDFLIITSTSTNLELSNILNRTENAIIQRKNHLRKCGKMPSKAWTEEEDKILLSKKFTVAELSFRLNRCKNSIYSRIKFLEENAKEL